MKQYVSPFERGEADNYYGRPATPHFIHFGRIVNKEHMTEEEIEAYYAGYDENEAAGLKKQY